VPRLQREAREARTGSKDSVGLLWNEAEKFGLVCASITARVSAAEAGLF
jgi:hypothetical protein